MLAHAGHSLSYVLPGALFVLGVVVATMLDKRRRRRTHRGWRVEEVEAQIRERRGRRPGSR